MWPPSRLRSGSCGDLLKVNREEFLIHYHRCSSVESVFSMVKVKFGDSVRYKSDTGQVNEALCKVLCHNICVLIYAMHALGVHPVFRDAQTSVGRVM
jgi:hypothetical protein